MFPTGKGPMDEMMKPGREMFEFWISFFPTAPLFGVEWRFGAMMPKAGTMTWSVPNHTMPTAPAGKPAEKTAAKAATKKTVMLTAELAEKPAERTAPKPAVRPVAKLAPKPAAKTDVKPAASKKAAAKPVKSAKPAKTAKPKDGRPAALMTEKPAKIDDLKLIKGIGPGLEKELNGLGVYRFEQMAGFDKADLTWIDTNLTAFKGRCFRDDWAGQAKALMG